MIKLIVTGSNFPDVEEGLHGELLVTSESTPLNSTSVVVPGNKPYKIPVLKLEPAYLSGKIVTKNVLPDVQAFLEEDTEIIFVLIDSSHSSAVLAAPLIAKKAKELGVLTIGVVCLPFSPGDAANALPSDESLLEIRKSYDSILSLFPDTSLGTKEKPNSKMVLQQTRGVIMSTIQSIVHLQDVQTEVNVDLQDVRYVLADAGEALVGTAVASGPGRSACVIEEALGFNGNLNKELSGARKILISVMSGEETELDMEELIEITDAIQAKAGEEAEVIFGHGTDPYLGDNIRVTLIASGFPGK